jgi:hypothetical protein
MMVPVESRTEYVDVAAAMETPPVGQHILLDMANLDWDSFVATQEVRP